MPESEKKQYLCDDRTVPYILIVDDSLSDICLLESILRSHGFVSQSLTDPTEVFEHCQSARPEIVLLDISMPGMNGFQVCAQLKNDLALSTIPVLFLTAMCRSRLIKSLRSKDLLAYRSSIRLCRPVILPLTIKSSSKRK
ncbi:MAG: response regulator, partial [Candidatus Electrothrix sp. AR5]|nr:response regulator [Candidatus Electrothrix sp. AR5]